MLLSTKKRAQAQFILSLATAALVCVLLLALGAYTVNSGRYDYLVWNLFLASLPLVFSARLRHILKRKRWSAWESISWSLLWVLFLPNSFYMISDYIHLNEINSADILFNSVVFTAFIFLGVIMGYASVYQVHRELRERFRAVTCAAWLGVLYFATSVAIYIGRDLRWNSWDVLFSPFGLLFDISERVLRPGDYPNMFVTVLFFFALLTSMYAVVWSGAKVLRLRAD